MKYTMKDYEEVAYFFKDNEMYARWGIGVLERYNGKDNSAEHGHHTELVTAPEKMIPLLNSLRNDGHMPLGGTPENPIKDKSTRQMIADGELDLGVGIMPIVSDLVEEAHEEMENAQDDHHKLNDCLETLKAGRELDSTQYAFLMSYAPSPSLTK